MLYDPSNGRKLEEFMRTKGMHRLPYALEREGSKVVADVNNGHSMVL
jgi:hypothetical protein